MTTLATARLLLVPVGADDVDPLVALFHEPFVRRYLLDDRVVEPAWVAEQVGASRARFTAGSLGLYRLAPLDARHETIGLAGFLPIGEPPALELLYALRPAMVGRGLATEAATALVGHAFRTLPIDVVRSSVDEPNVASIRVLERLGMEPAGSSPGPAWRQLHFALGRARWAVRGGA